MDPVDVNENIFKKALVLSYYRDNFEQSSFIELTKMMGLTLHVLDELIQTMIQENYLNYNDNNLLRITRQGELFLEDHKIYNFSFQNIEIASALFNKNPIGIDDIYIPKRFTNK